jgi:hypothetical protein
MANISNYEAPHNLVPSISLFPFLLDPIFFFSLAPYSQTPPVYGHLLSIDEKFHTSIT